MRINVRGKLLGTSVVLIAFTVVACLAWIFTLASVNDLATRVNQNVVNPLEQIGVARAKFNENRNFLTAHILENTPEKKAEYETKALANDVTILEDLTAFKATLVTDEAKTAWATLEERMNAYIDGRKQVWEISKTGTKDEAYAALGKVTRPIVNEIVPLFQQLFDSKAQLGDTMSAEIQSTFDTSRLIAIAMMILSVVIGLILSWVLASRVVKGVKSVQVTLGALAEKGLTWIAEGLERLRDGDLTYEITPVTPRIEHYGTDEIGKTAEYTNIIRDKVFAAAFAYNEARTGLAGTITEVQEAADSVTRTSEQLNEAASQTGAA
ncbi:MAG: MCP four helix bundle domain-containing protein, partial [Chloroflexota bacterium]